MSPPGGRRCPPALLALLLGLAGSRGSPECQNRAVTEGGSLCLVPEEPPGKWTEIHWKWDINSGELQKILTARRGGNVSYPRGLFHGRATFQPGNLSLCISPVGGDDNGVYRAEFETSGAISARCFRVSVWEPVPQPELKSQILERARGWCRLALLCSSPGNVSYSWRVGGHTWDGSSLVLWVNQTSQAEPEPLTCTARNPVSSRNVTVTAPGVLCAGSLSSSRVGVGGGFLILAGILLAASLLIFLLLLWKSRGWTNFRLSQPKPADTAAGATNDYTTVYAEVGPSQQRVPDGTKAKPAERGPATTIYSLVRRPEQVGGGTADSAPMAGLELV